MKNISTLVSDIYALMKKDQPLTETQVEDLSVNLCSMLKRRLCHPQGERAALSMSSFGSKCLRQLWYKQNMPGKAETLAPQTRIKFLYGDILEELLLTLAKASGHSVEGEQDTLDVAGVKGHRDAVIDGVTVDVKSANSRSFEKFKYHKLETDDPFGYVDQLSLYVEGGKNDEKVKVKGQGAFLAIDKELGDIALDVYKKRDSDYSGRADELREVLGSDEPPKRGHACVPDGKSGNEVIPMPCRYCQFKTECHKESNNGLGLRKFIFSTGPRWFTRVVREPDVPEVEA